MLMSLHSISNRRGFTLIELMVTIMLIGLLMGVVVSGMGGGDRVIAESADRLAATMRFLHDKAATEGSYIRLVLDLDEQSYWVEATGDPYLLSRPDESLNETKTTEVEAEAEKSVEIPQPEADAAGAEESASGSLLPKEVKPLQPKEPKFSQTSDFLLKASKLPDGALFKDVYVEHLQAAAAGGKVTIAFFPNGYVEEAVINLHDDDDKYTYSLKTQPLLGRVDVADGYRELEAAP